MWESAVLRMETKILIVLLLALTWTQCVQSQLPSDISCRNFATEAINLPALSGIWYEAGRVPNEDVMNCLNVSVPATVDEQLDLRLEYLSRINGKDQVVKETITFPWDNNTQNGIFNLDYNGPSASMSVTYKIVYTIPKVVTFICGYASISPIPLLKIFSRERQISQQTIEMVNSFLTAAGYADDIIWTDQSFARCNAAVRPAIGAISIFALAIVWCLSRWN
ncbi:uncharacterized protein LOC116805474 [Drosophila grimshawi]|uniref:uncharacterized protein LOC116805474 n=1 Tax=Drosophila grimshawi TaxID=7222 RepID=UPI0013EF3C3F|nr:uncharacterized protein LOC116805474 [Drosophila grimshawi]